MMHRRINTLNIRKVLISNNRSRFIINNLNMIDMLYIKGMVSGNSSITMTSFKRMIVIIIIIKDWKHNIIISNRIVIFQSVFICKHIIIFTRRRGLKYIIISSKRILKHLIPKLRAFYIITGGNMDSTNSIAIIIFIIDTKEIFNIKSGVISPIMITNISNRHRFIIKFRIISNSFRRNIPRGRYLFLSPLTPPPPLLLLLLPLFRRERHERKIYHITWFRNNRSSLGGFLSFIN